VGCATGGCCAGGCCAGFNGSPKRSSQVGSSAIVLPFVRVGDLARRSSRCTLKVESVLHDNNSGNLINNGT
jgi:hypothetical protein